MSYNSMNVFYPVYPPRPVQVGNPVLTSGDLTIAPMPKRPEPVCHYPINHLRMSPKIIDMIINSFIENIPKAVYSKADLVDDKTQIYDPVLSELLFDVVGDDNNVRRNRADQVIKTDDFLVVVVAHKQYSKSEYNTSTEYNFISYESIIQVYNTPVALKLPRKTIVIPRPDTFYETSFYKMNSNRYGFVLLHDGITTIRDIKIVDGLIQIGVPVESADVERIECSNPVEDEPETPVEP